MAINTGPATPAGNSVVRVFTTSGIFTPYFTGTVEVLVVAGGGGGGMDMGGGGGGGGVISNTSVSVTSGTPVTVTVGAGGYGAPAGSGGYRTDGAGPQPSGHQFTISATNGSNSVFGALTAIGGGYGGSSYFGYTPNNGYGNTGGSGGGASGYSDGTTGRQGAGTAGQGNSGGASTGQYYSGGGGGAGAAGSNGATPNGGAGIANSILGSVLYWGGGGGGASYSSGQGGNGGIGGGGGGANGTTVGGAGYNTGSPGGGGPGGAWANTPGGNGAQNTGGGGGGGAHYNATNKGGEGGAGIVVVRYPSSLGASAGGALIDQSSLKFSYNMSDPTSFIGAVGTNQFAIPVPDGSNNVSFAVQGTGTFQRLYSGTYGGYTITNNDVVYQYNLVSAGGCYYHGNDVSITAGQWATMTFDYYVSPGAGSYPITNFLASFESAVSASASDPTPSITGVWKTATITAQAGTTGTCRMLLYPGACNGTSLASSGYILYKNPQVLITSASTTTSPFTGPFGARSATQALIDDTGLNKPVVNSLTYNATGTSFSFNGTSDSITVPFNASQFTFNNEQTIIIWMKNQSPSTARRNPYNQAYGGAGTITHENDTNFNYFYGTAGTNSTPYTSHTSPFNVVVGETAQIAITRNTSITAWYKNGALGNTQANPYGATVVTGTSDITIGSGYAGAFGGSLYIVQIYNRALSADEIAANFNAYRGRYGL